LPDGPRDKGLLRSVADHRKQTSGERADLGRRHGCDEPKLPTGLARLPAGVASPFEADHTAAIL